MRAHGPTDHVLVRAVDSLYSKFNTIEDADDGRETVVAIVEKKSHARDDLRGRLTKPHYQFALFDGVIARWPLCMWMGRRCGDLATECSRWMSEKHSGFVERFYCDLHGLDRWELSVVQRDIPNLTFDVRPHLIGGAELDVALEVAFLQLAGFRRG